MWKKDRMYLAIRDIITMQCAQTDKKMIVRHTARTTSRIKCATDFSRESITGRNSKKNCLSIKNIELDTSSKSLRMEKELEFLKNAEKFRIDSCINTARKMRKHKKILIC